MRVARPEFETEVATPQAEDDEYDVVAFGLDDEVEDSVPVPDDRAEGSDVPASAPADEVDETRDDAED